MNAKSKLSEALAASPDVLEYIISLNPHDFQRLRNPLMRKVMPPRITLGRIATMVGITEQEIVDKVNKLAGLPRENAGADQSHLPTSSKEMPDWLKGVDFRHIEWVDLVEVDENLGDPMPPISIAVNRAKPGEVVGIIHKWEPQPFYDIWNSRGFQFWSEQIGPDEWHIFVLRS